MGFREALVAANTAALKTLGKTKGLALRTACPLPQ